MCNFNEKFWDSLPDARKDKIIQEYREWVEKLVAELKP